MFSLKLLLAMYVCIFYFLFMFKEAPKIKSQKYTEQFTCRLPIEVKLLERKAKALGLDVGDIARISLNEGFTLAIKLYEKELEAKESEAS